MGWRRRFKLTFSTSCSYNVDNIEPAAMTLELLPRTTMGRGSLAGQVIKTVPGASRKLGGTYATSPK